MINGTEISKNGLAAAFLMHNILSLTFSKTLSLIPALKLKNINGMSNFFFAMTSDDNDNASEVVKKVKEN